jgi:hypothetical protein
MKSFIEQFSEFHASDKWSSQLGTKTATKEDVDTHGINSIKTITTTSRETNDVSGIIGSTKTLTETKESLDSNSFHFGTMTRSKETSDSDFQVSLSL